MEGNCKFIDLFEPFLTFTYPRCRLRSLCLCYATIFLVCLCLTFNTLVTRLKLEGHSLGVCIFVK